MTRNNLVSVLRLLAVLDSYIVDVDIFGFALLRVNLFDVSLKLPKGLIILSETVIDVASDSVAISSIPSAIIVFILLLVFVDEVQRLV